MQPTYYNYSFSDSILRIDNILDATDNLFEEVENIPSRENLTYQNGYYVNCCALFADIRESSNLPNNHYRPKIAKLYRAYTSEIVAILNSSNICVEINIHGDCVWGVFQANYTTWIDAIISLSAQISSFINILNYKLKKKGISEINVGVGISYGRSLMIQAGYKGSGIKDLLWMGNVVNEASQLSGLDTCGHSALTRITNTVYNNLNEHNKGLFSLDYVNNCYKGSIINVDMNEWYNINCK